MVGMKCKKYITCSEYSDCQCSTSPYMDITTLFTLMLQRFTISCEAHEIKELPVPVQLLLAAQETSHPLYLWVICSISVHTGVSTTHPWWIAVKIRLSRGVVHVIDSVCFMHCSDSLQSQLFYFQQ